MNADPVLDPADLFAQVYAEPTPQLREQAALLREELRADEEQGEHRNQEQAA
jgi:2-oxoisovalerate dehydrogenase E1 component alpha subunit